MTAASSDPAPGLREKLAPNADNWLLWLLLPAGVVLYLLRPQSPVALLQLIDGRTLCALTGLLAITKGVELSGVLQHLSQRIVTRVPNQRRLALLLVALSAALAAVLTNDVSLFLIVPLTCSLAGSARLPLARLVVFEALAVNAGSALTPIGNPQNLFLWQSSGVGFGAFVVMMGPAVGVILALLVGATVLAFPPAPLQLHGDGSRGMLRPWLLGLSVIVFVVFICMLDLNRQMQALLAVFAAYALIDQRVLLKLDWMLLSIIVLMFVDLGQLAHLPVVAAWLHRLPISEGGHAYLAGIATSQVISNVPATILLRHDVTDLRALAWGVNVGGFGLLVGSLANLIALRLAKQPGSFRLFHLISVPFLLATATAIYLLYYCPAIR